MYVTASWFGKVLCPLSLEKAATVPVSVLLGDISTWQATLHLYSAAATLQACQRNHVNLLIISGSISSVTGLDGVYHFVAVFLFLSEASVLSCTLELRKTFLVLGDISHVIHLCLGQTYMRTWKTLETYIQFSFMLLTIFLWLFFWIKWFIVTLRLLRSCEAAYVLIQW